MFYILFCLFFSFFFFFSSSAFLFLFHFIFNPSHFFCPSIKTKLKTKTNIGAGEDALALLPIDTAGRDRGKKNRPDTAPSPNYFSDVIPQGLVSANVKVVHQALQLKKREVVSELSHGWQSSSLIEAISLKETKKDRAQLSILSQHNSERRKSVIGSTRKAKLDNLDEAINAFIVNHQVDMEDEFSNKNKQSTAELDDMMRVLEEHMLNSNIEMTNLEERLTDRYLELEQLASEITEVSVTYIYYYIYYYLCYYKCVLLQ